MQGSLQTYLLQGGPALESEPREDYGPQKESYAEPDTQAPPQPRDFSSGEWKLRM
jgi:hypothetical protein